MLRACVRENGCLREAHEYREMTLYARDARTRASGLAGLEANARLDEGVAVEVACASRDEDADGETKTAKPGRGEAFAAAPRAAAKALGAGAASGTLRAAMVEAGFRVGERVDVVGA